MHLRERALNEIARMAADPIILAHAVVEILSEVAERTGLHRGIGIELEAPTLCIDDAEPAHIGVIARLLRTNVGEVLIGHLVLIDAQEL